MKPKQKSYWRQHLQELQRALNTLAAAGIPGIELAKPPEAVRKFNGRLERILKGLGIRRRYQNEIVANLHGGIIASSRSKHEQAQMWLALLKDLGVETTPAEMLEVLDGWEAMEGFTFRSAKRAVSDHFQDKDLRVHIQVADDEDDDLEEVVFEEEQKE